MAGAPDLHHHEPLHVSQGGVCQGRWAGALSRAGGRCERCVIGVCDRCVIGVL